MVRFSAPRGRGRRADERRADGLHARAHRPTNCPTRPAPRRQPANNPTREKQSGPVIRRSRRRKWA